MPQTKMTERKHCICPVCKELVHKETFTDHLVQCAANRVECQQCEATFKNKAYLAKHMKAKHEELKLHGEKAKKDLPKSSKQRSFVLMDEPEEWDNDPDIDIDEPESETSKKSEVKSKSSKTSEIKSDVTKGRIIRKGTHPLPVCAPKKAKSATETLTEYQARKEKSDQAETSVSETGSMKKIQGNNKNCSDSQTIPKTVRDAELKSAEISVIIKKEKTVSQEIVVHHDGEKIYSTFNILKSEGEEKEPTVNLGMFLPSDAVVKAENIDLNREIINREGKSHFK